MVKSERKLLNAVMLCHFIASFSALGIPPFYDSILKKSLDIHGHMLSGWFYVTPTLFAAIAAPLWGKFADKIGRKISLLRAQIGLSLSFLLAGFAETGSMFFIALCLQGILGGTFAASNAYLTDHFKGMQLTKSLNYMQGSARAALVAAPICFGFFIGIESPIELYKYIAILPLISALLLSKLPAETKVEPTLNSKTHDFRSMEIIFTFPQILLIQSLFIFALASTFPYLIPLTKNVLGSDFDGYSGFLFSLPHLVYLLIVWVTPIEKHLRNGKGLLIAGTISLSLSVVAHLMATSFSGFVLARLLMGIGMTLGYISIHHFIANASSQRAETGKMFGWLDGFSKWASVLSGLCVGIAAETYGVSSSFYIAFIGFIGMFFPIFLPKKCLNPTYN